MGTHRVLGGRQDLFDHHAVPSKGTPVQCVGPIRTEGAEATCYRASQRRGRHDRVMGRRVGQHGRKQTKHKHKHRKKSKESVTTCNLQGTFLLFLTCWTRERLRGSVEGLREAQRWKMRVQIVSVRTEAEKELAEAAVGCGRRCGFCIVNADVATLCV